MNMFGSPSLQNLRKASQENGNANLARKAVMSSLTGSTRKVLEDREVNETDSKKVQEQLFKKDEKELYNPDYEPDYCSKRPEIDFYEEFKQETNDLMHNSFKDFLKFSKSYPHEEITLPKFEMPESPKWSIALLDELDLEKEFYEEYVLPPLIPYEDFAF